MANIDPELAKVLEGGLNSPITALVAFQPGADVSALLERVTARAGEAPIQCVRQGDAYDLVVLAHPLWVRQLVQEPEVASVRGNRYSGARE